MAAGASCSNLCARIRDAGMQRPLCWCIGMLSGDADNQPFASPQGHGPADIKWEKYFEDPSLWWDNRATKRNPKQPDFVHKTDRWLFSPWGFGASSRNIVTHYCIC